MENQAQKVIALTKAAFADYVQRVGTAATRAELEAYSDLASLGAKWRARGAK